LPDVAAKEAAWASVFGGGDALSNYVMRATVEGFWQVEQRELLVGAGFVERYFADAVRVASRRGAAVASVVGRYGFPGAVAPESVLRSGSERVAGADVPAALRREWVDRLDTVLSTS
jgi:aminopeptidase N